MKKIFLILAILFSGIVQANDFVVDNVASIAKKSQIMDFPGCKKYVTELTQHNAVEILEDTAGTYKLKIYTEDACVIITCTRSILGTKH
ncbi:hypothetical protein [Cricetibacter osteomyelitidis]|nr:hypothetical protein [Cricetibacter osteomyelitidis]